ncbi:MAG: PIN domain-containing protein [Actinomycetia bacterium]|nr:PIN domain-containing protein [Actinomycetes bacterium]
MSVDNFLDTNVFIYLLDETDLHKHRSADRLVQQNLGEGSGCISYQVVQETINVVTRRLNATPGQARQLPDDVLIPLWLATPLEGSTAAVSTCGGRYGFSYYDSLIAAAALDAGCKTLYSEDLQHG